jgi:hypothetical protein
MAGSGEPRARITLRAREIAASMAFDTLHTGYAARKAARLAAAGLAGAGGVGRAVATDRCGG